MSYIVNPKHPDVNDCRAVSSCLPYYCTECRELFEDDEYPLNEQGKLCHLAVCDDGTMELCGPLIDHCDKCIGED